MTRDTGWFKRSYSDAGNDQCVKVRIIGGEAVGVRDSKNPGGGALWLAPSAWTAFVTQVRTV